MSPFGANDVETMVSGGNALKQWTRNAHATMVDDSRVDPFTRDRHFAKVRGRPNVAVVGVTADGDVLRTIYSSPVTELGESRTKGVTPPRGLT